MQRKNFWRREETARVRESRIITGYVKYKYPEVFSEAKEFYDELNELYPNKKDLRRTNEFEWLKTGTGTKQRKFYERKRKDQKKKKDVTDNMVLRIPLLNQQESATRTAEIVQETAAETGTAEMPQETTAGPGTEETEIPVVIEPQEVTLPPISDEIIEDIMNGLREDPDIQNIFDYLDIEFDDCPLESELIQW